MENISTWLLDQAPVIVVMGLVIYWLQKRLVKAEDDKDKLSENVIKLTTLWESKASELGEDDKEFKEKVLESLNEIKITLKTKHYNNAE